MTGRGGLSRRAFLVRSAATTGGLVLGFHLATSRPARAQDSAPANKSPMSPNAYIRIGADDSVTILLKHSEMGQGVATSLAMAVAEELGCDWTKVRTEHAPAGPDYYHAVFQSQMTGGSTSTWESFDQMRTVGAAAREMLLAAAAARWNVSAALCKAENGVVTSGDKKATYGELADDAMKQPVPGKPTLKAPSAWKLIGKATHRLDSPAKVTGKAEFGIDVKRPGMLVALVARPPTFGAKLKRFDGAKAKLVPGVASVLQIPSGVAVLGEHFWAAHQGRAALEIEWDAGEFAKHATDQQLASYRAQAKTAGLSAASNGDVDAALAKAGKVVEAEYDVPYLAHATMEPMNATAEVRDDACEVWTGTQLQTADQHAAAKIAGLRPEQVQIHTTFLGGGFGRRANPQSDFVSEAVHLAKLSKRPVKVVWTREDDMRGGWYRPLWLSRIRGAVDDAGKIVAWAHTIVGQSIVAGTPFAAMIKNGLDETSVEGSADSPYLAGLPNHRVDLHSPTLPVPVLWWRSVGHSHTAFVVETFLDELAHAAGKDPVAFRQALLPEGSKMRRVLEAAADAFGWGKELPAGHAAGIAVHDSFKSVVAHAVEVSIEQGKVRVHRVASAIDCGQVVNPDGVEAQLQSGVVYGLSAALYGEITFKDGKVQQSNFHDYPLVRMLEMPRVEVRIVKSDEPMGGVGEPGVPPVAPAVANALFVLTKKRHRRLPLRLT